MHIDVTVNLSDDDERDYVFHCDSDELATALKCVAWAVTRLHPDSTSFVITIGNRDSVPPTRSTRQQDEEDALLALMLVL